MPLDSRILIFKDAEGINGVLKKAVCEKGRIVIAAEKAFSETVYTLISLGGYIMSEKEKDAFDKRNVRTKNVQAMLFAIGAKTCKNHKFLIYTVKNVNKITENACEVPVFYVIKAEKEVLT